MLTHCINSLFYNLEQTSRICRAGFEQYFENHVGKDITFDEFIILDTILCHPDICQRDLAKMILKGASHTSKILFTLEKKGLIMRHVDKKGNRIIKKIVITEKGHGVYLASSTVALEFTNSIEQIIGQDKAKECFEFLNKIKNSISETTNTDFE
jgi:DNA-binding MarR family transcriptional regulator